MSKCLIHLYIYMNTCYLFSYEILIQDANSETVFVRIWSKKNKRLKKVSGPRPYIGAESVEGRLSEFRSKREGEIVTGR